MGAPTYDAIVLAGGAGSRLGGVDKPDIAVAGRSLLNRALDAVERAGRVVIAGDQRLVQRTVHWVREQPVRSGPAAAVAAALPLIQAETVVLLACDMPLAGAATVERLLGALVSDAAADGVVLVDQQGHRQPLAAAYRTVQLRAAVTQLGQIEAAPMRQLISGLRLVEIPARGLEALDCDTWADVDTTNRLLEEA